MKRLLLSIPCSVFLLSLLLVGCSHNQNAEDYLTSADELYQEDDLEAAEVEYLNVIQNDPQQPHAIARLGMIFFAQGRPLEATRFLLAARELDPTNAEIQRVLGTALVAIGDFSRAREAINASLELDASNPDAWLALAEVARDEETLVDTKSRLETAANVEATRPAALVSLASLAVRGGDVDEAINLTDQAIALAPEFGTAHFARGNLHLLQGENDLALEKFAEATSFAPLRSPHRLRYAQALAQKGEMDKAEAVLTEITDAAPGYLPAWMLRSEFAVSQGNLENGLARIERVLMQDSVLPEALLAKARILLGLGQSEEAEQILRRAVDLYPTAGDFRYQLGLALLAQGDLVESKNALLAALEANPESDQTAMILATIEIRAANYGAAIPLLRGVIERTPGNLSAWPMLADAHRLQGDADTALAIYDQMDENFGEISQTASGRGDVLMSLGRLDEAKAAFADAVERDANNMGAVERIVTLMLRQGELDEADEIVESKITAQPDSPLLYVLRSQVKFAQENSDEARKALEKAIELDPELARAYFLLAGISFQEKDWQEAIRRLNQTVEKSPNNLQALMMLGLVYDQEAQREEATEVYEKIIALNPNAVVALNNLAYIYADQGQLESALNTAQQARELMPNDPNIADTLGWIAHQKGEQRWALSLIEEAATGLETSGEAQFHLGAVRYNVGNETGAREALTRAVELAPDREFAAEAGTLLRILDSDANRDYEIVLERLKTQPSDPVALLRKINRLSGEGNSMEALQTARMAAAQNQGNFPLRVKLAALEAENGDLNAARVAAESAYELEPENPLGIAEVAAISFKRGEHSRAFSMWQSAVNLAPNDSSYQLGYALAAFSIAQTERFETLLNEVTANEVTGDNREHALRLLEMWSWAKAPDTAPDTIPSVEATLAADANHPVALFTRARLAQAKGQTDEAVTDYESLHLHYPQFHPATRELVRLTANQGDRALATLAIALEIRPLYRNDAELAATVGRLHFNQLNFSQAVFVLEEAVRSGLTGPEIDYYLGSSLVENGEFARGAPLLAQALANGLQGDRRTQAEARLERAQAATTN